MAFRRKYKFNWIDHLYYTGKDVAVWSVWFYFEFFFVLVPLLLVLCCVGAMLIRQTANVALIHISIYAACALAVVLYSEFSLKKYLNFLSLGFGLGRTASLRSL